uniref:50S ribosomal protein L2 n=1 Tax=Nephromyces sp. ex Molgula occidentalis TaxID=2544991 RepID=A0A5C1H9F7_9APIC|nr:50S ribosomal protein L2 [Nephromyces sp. ex Molgula occidentalis]
MAFSTLNFKYNSSMGRNNTGKITSRFLGGGVKKLYRKIDFKYSNYSLNSNLAILISKHYDPYRNTYIGLIKNLNGKIIGLNNYILLPDNLQEGDLIFINFKLENKPGTSKALKYWAIGNILCNIEFKPFQGGKIARAAGTNWILLNLDKKYALLKMPSGEERLISNKWYATIGTINFKNKPGKLFKAGQKRNLNKRPHVRGVAMNAFDHPHGGGEGRSRIGKKNIYSPWKKVSLNKKVIKSKYIILRRKNK